MFCSARNRCEIPLGIRGFQLIQKRTYSSHCQRPFYIAIIMKKNNKYMRFQTRVNPIASLVFIFSCGNPLSLWQPCKQGCSTVCCVQHICWLMFYWLTCFQSSLSSIIIFFSYHVSFFLCLRFVFFSILFVSFLSSANYI